ncbi:MAG TPA: hypothetical protein VIG76_01915 [Amnibacterium sp.]|uniref:hypothetical protein n=1 Tax=Amnibacterium sp. TaxID=1872496 RepID=UPI002F95F66A
MSAPGLTVSGGGSAAVDTPAMQIAAVRLDDLAQQLGTLAAGLEACLADAAWRDAAQHRASEALQRAADVVRILRPEADDAAHGLRTAAERYGSAEQTIAGAQQAAWAQGAAAVGAVTRLGVTLAGPGFLVLTASATGALLGAAAAGTVARELLTTGRIDPQVDPAVLADLRLALSSSDDLIRGFELTERPADLVDDDPGSPHGTAATADALAGVLPAPRTPIAVSPSVLPGAVQGPGSLAGLGSRTPEVDPGGTQLRLEQYPMPGGGSRWIVYVCGTITFSPESGPEPFDLRSDVTGVAGQRSDSELALASAMRAAGVRPDDPVLLVGHSQGALDAVRLAQRGEFDVQGVVTLGGPTGQLELRGDVPELSVEHEEDPVPSLAGLPAAGAGGLHRLVVRRSLYGGGAPPGPPILPFGAGAQPHALTAYRETLALADESPDPRLVAFVDGIRPFLAARDGRIVLVRADRRVSPRRRR